MINIAFVTTFCPHHRKATFEVLATYYNVQFIFFSPGDEWYWQKEHGVQVGNFQYEYLPGFRLGRTRITPFLPQRLWQGNFDVYIKCINGRFALPITYIIARIRKKPFILWTGIWARLNTPMHRLMFPLTRYIYNHADAIVTYGEHVKRYLLTEGVSSERIFVAAHAVDNDAYNYEISEDDKNSLRNELGLSPEHKVVLYLGRLEEIKGLTYLIEAFANLQREDSILILAGDGTEHHYLENIVQKKKIAHRVRFAGYVPSEKAVLYYSIAWVLVLPSITLSQGKELWGLVVNETFNQSVPVIATDAVGAAAGGLVKDGINGFVVPERDSSVLAKALQRILEDIPLRHQLSYNARQIIHTWNNEQMVLGFRQAIEYVTRKFS